MGKAWVGLMGLLVVACSSGASDPPKVCHLGALPGTWRLHYEIKQGTCGPIADETITLTGGQGVDADSPGAPCTVAVNSVSSDRCAQKLDFTCPVNGATRWQSDLWQSANDTIVETETATTPVCSATYQVTWTKL